MPTYAFSEGGVWDNRDWAIESSNVVPANSSRYGHQDCRHSRIIDGRLVTPFVVVASNEGGYNSTGVCAECVVEAMQAIRDGKVQPEEE